MRSSILPIIALIISAFFFAFSIMEQRQARDIASVTASVTQYVTDALHELEEWGNADGPVAGLPADMSLYRYENDSLVYWKHPLPLINDKIDTPSGTRKAIASDARLIPLHYGRKPISGLNEHFRFTTLGSKWYLARLVNTRKGATRLEALYICDARNGLGKRSISQRLHLPDNCFISDLPQEIGYPVIYDGQALFFIGSRPQDSLALLADSDSKWAGLAFLALFFVLLLRKRPGYRLFIFTVLALTVCYLIARFWGSEMDNNLFSAQLYAGGPIWSSYGNLMLQNIYLFLLAFCVYPLRRKMIAWTLDANGNKRFRLALTGSFLALCIMGLAIYIIASGYSFLQNSSMPVYLNQSSAGMGLRIFTILIYTLLFAAWVLFVLMAHDLLDAIPVHIPRLDIKTSLFIALFLSISLSFAIAVIGMDKEQQRTQM